MGSLGYILGAAGILIILLVIRKVSKKGNGTREAITMREELLKPPSQYETGSYESHLDAYQTDNARRVLRSLYDYSSDSPEVVRSILLNASLPPHLVKEVTKLQNDTAKLLEFIEEVADVVDSQAILSALAEPKQTRRATFEAWYECGKLPLKVARLVGHPDEIRKLYASTTD